MRFEARDLIKEVIEKYKDSTAVACSFGKDSIAVLHLALKIDPNIKVIFNNTGVEFPETIKYKEKLKKEWNLNLIETKPIKTFWECIDKYGVPKVRGKGKNRVPKCCIYCKEKPALESYKDNNIRAVITGLLKCESRNRALLITRYDNSEKVGTCGQRYYSKTWDVWKIHPIAYWSEREVWYYIKKNNIPINPVYTKWGGIYNRCGCLPCTAYLSWEKKLSKSHPKLYRKLKKLSDPYQKTLK